MEQFSAHEREEITERTGRTAVRSVIRMRGSITLRGSCHAYFRNGTLVFGGVDRRSFGGILGGQGVFSDSDVRHYRNLVHAGAPVGALQITARTLRSANGTGIEVLGCSRCSVSFLGLRTEFPIIVCSLAAGTDAIIGTDVLGSVLPHTLDIKNGLLFAQGGASLQLHRRDSALSGRVFTVGHSSIPPYSEAVLHCSVRTTGGRALSSSGLL